MTDMRDSLKSHIKAVIEGIRHFDVESAADLIAEVADEISEDRAEDDINGAILDGIRWGYHAAVVVEMGGGAMLRVVLPGGIVITHDWAADNDARAQINAALDAVALTRDAEKQRVIAQGAGQ